MKSVSLLFVSIVLSPVRADDARPAGKVVPAQELPAPPALPTDTAQKAPPTIESGSGASPAPSLLPDPIQPAPKPPLPVAKKPPLPLAKTNSATLRPPATSAELDLRIRYRRARNIAESDRRVRAAWDESRIAKTDLAKRNALKRYYDVLFGKMLVIDSGLAPLVEQRRHDEAAILEQLHIAPTGSLE